MQPTLLTRKMILSHVLMHAHPNNNINYCCCNCTTPNVFSLNIPAFEQCSLNSSLINRHKNVEV